jgi:pimeloyl-ACP methyl ester carboxylesterase
MRGIAVRAAAPARRGPLATQQKNGAATMGDHRAERRTVGGVELELLSGGRGESLLVLHDQEYFNEWQPFETALAEQFSVLVPSHPGFGQSEFPPYFDSIDDLVYVYLDLLRGLDQPANVVGLGIGGWIAAEIAIRCTHHLRRLVLCDAVGIKVGGISDRDIADTFILGNKELVELSFHDPTRGNELMKVPAPNLDEQTLTAVLRNRQTSAILTWKPFMHDPKLRGRLARLNEPTLVLWGENDKIVSTDYGRAYADAIPGARFETIAAAGHYPYLEQPDAFTAAVSAFLRQG